MSRLDDELKIALRRQEPSADFAERLLARLPAAPQPQRRWWDSLAEFFQPNALRLAAATAVVLLIAAIGLVQYQRSGEPASTASTKAPQTPPAEQRAAAPPEAPAVDQNNGQDESRASSTTKSITTERRHRRVRHHHAARRPGNHNVVTNPGTPDTVVAGTTRSQGEMARDQLMKALSIASTLISEARDGAIGGKD